jgi:hypothetical protein
VLQRPGQQALAILGHLLAVAQHDRVLADEVDAADVAVEIDADAGPVEARRYLLDMRRLAGAVIAVDEDAAVVGEAGEDGERGVVVEAVGLVDVGHMVVGMREGRHLHVAVEAEGLPHRDGDVREGKRGLCRAGRCRSHGLPSREGEDVVFYTAGGAIRKENSWSSRSHRPG